jgi:hypothetical protein
MVRAVLSGILLAGLIAPLAACGQGENEPGPGGVTVGEARALDEAAEMLEERRLPPEDLQTGPAAEPTGLSTGAAR